MAATDTWMQDTGRSGDSVYPAELAAGQHVAIHEIGEEDYVVDAPVEALSSLLHCRHLTTPMLHAFYPR